MPFMRLGRRGALAIAKRAFRLVPPKFQTCAVNFGFKYASFALKDSPAYHQWKIRQEYKAHIQGGMSAEGVEAYFKAAEVGAKSFVLISHGRGGGTESHIKELSRALRDEGVDVWVLRMIDAPYAQLLRERDVVDEHDFGVCVDLDEGYGVLEHALGLLKPGHIHLHHTLDFPDSMLSWLPDYSGRVQVPFDMTLHDYFAICPRFTLTEDSTHAYCGEPEVRRCTLCVHRFGSPVGNHVDVAGWREDYGALMRQARKIFVPNADVGERLARYYPDVAFSVMPHFDTKPTALPAQHRREDNEPLRILSIGAIAPHKGSKILLACAEDAKARNLPLEFTILGYTDIDWKFSHLKNIRITGKYNAAEQQQYLDEIQPHVALFPNVWPETYCYTLSEALRAGIYPVTLDIGAVAQRLRAIGWGRVLPLEYCTTPEKINDALMELRPAEEPRPDRAIVESFTEYKPFISSYYGLNQ